MEIKYKNYYFIKSITATDYDSNCYIIWNMNSKHAMIIDPNDFLNIYNIVKQNQLSVDYILVTHEHYDHIAGLCDVQQKLGGKAIASEKCKREMVRAQERLNKTYRLYMHFIEKEVKDSDIPKYKEGKIDISYFDMLNLEWEGLSFHIQETIGHSKGSSSILIDKTYIFSGDAVLKEKPIITNYLGGNKEDYKNSTISYYQQLNKNLMVLPGHGEMFELKEIDFL